MGKYDLVVFKTTLYLYCSSTSLSLQSHFLLWNLNESLSAIPSEIHSLS